MNAQTSPPTQRPTNAGAAVSARKSLIEYFDSPAVVNRVEVAVPKGVDHKYLLASFRLALAANLKLQQCTQVSLYTCLMKLAQTGLLPDGRDAHVLPYGDTATVLFDYKGIARLVMNSGEVSSLEVDCVHENDEFDFTRGAGGRLFHRPRLRGERGEMYAVYSYVTFSHDDRTSVCVMRKDEVDAVRGRSKAANNGPWVSDYNEMAKKTVFRRHSKLLPFSPQLRQRIESDDEPLNTEEARFAEAKRVAAPSRSFLSAPMPEDNGAEQPPEEIKRGPGRPRKEPEERSCVISAEQAKEFGAFAATQDAEDAAYAELARIVKANGFTLSQFLKIAESGGIIPDATSFGSIEDIPIATVKELLSNKEVFTKALNASKA